MKVTFDVTFQNSDGGGGSLGFARLEVDLPFAPSTDMEFEHPVWHEGKHPISITYNIENEDFLVTFETEHLTRAQYAQHRQIYEGHGWTVT